MDINKLSLTDICVLKNIPQKKIIKLLGIYPNSYLHSINKLTIAGCLDKDNNITEYGNNILKEFDDEYNSIKRMATEQSS